MTKLHQTLIIELEDQTVFMNIYFFVVLEQVRLIEKILEWMNMRKMTTGLVLAWAA